jgi:hypothetical protein
MSVATCGHDIVFTYCTALFGKHSLGGSSACVAAGGGIFENQL